MGCCESTPVVGDSSGKSRGAKPRVMTDLLSSEEKESRISASEETVKLECGGLTLRFAYVSQRGYYPDDPHKANQDAYSATTQFAEQNTDALFAVYDGHGREGDKCAQFARAKLPGLIEANIVRVKARYSGGSGTLMESSSQHSGRGDSQSSGRGGGCHELSKEQIQRACLKAHVQCNNQMHQDPAIDDSLSGTTSISVYVHGRRNRITVCNVGDSRAIVGRGGGEGAKEASTQLKAFPLSRDQTPYRRDERIRVRKTGARILSLDQLEGLEPIVNNDEEEVNTEDEDLELGEEIDEGGDPPRVWSPHGDYPGTAFTRSLGDAMAEELGVIGEPEMLTCELSSNDRILVLASDGVFEFLTNQSVIDICAKFSDPLEACRAVVAESYELWLQYELRTDDITMICIFLDQVRAPHVSSASRKNSLASSISTGLPPRPGGTPTASAEFPNAAAVDGATTPATSDDEGDDIADTFHEIGEGSKPVRSHLSKEKSKQIAKIKQQILNSHNNDEEDDDDEQDISKLMTEKTPQEKERIANAVRASVMFSNLSDEQRETIFGYMESIYVNSGDWIIKQGTKGDKFYIVDEGKFEVRIVPEGEEDVDGNGGGVVHVYEGSAKKNMHPSFGELALMHSAPRAASIIATSNGHLWALRRSAFRKVLASGQRTELMGTLQTIPAFSEYNDEIIKDLAACMHAITYGRGETIIEQGKEGKTMFVVSSGNCEHVQVKSGKPRQTSMRAGDFFGEEVLEQSSTYEATVVALQTTSCWTIEKSTLQKILASAKGK